MRHPLRYTLFFYLFFLQSVAFADPRLVIHVDGLTGAVKKNVLARLHLIRPKNEQNITSAIIERWHVMALTNIKRALQPFGFYKPIIHSQLIHNEHQWIAHYKIDQGKPLKVTALHISLTGEGKDHPQLKKLVSQFPLKRGDPLLTEKYKQGKQAFFTTAQQLGFLNAKMLAHHVAIDLKNNTSTITIHFNTGPVFKFGPVQFSQTNFNAAFLRRFIPFKQGDIYSAKQLFKLQDDLSTSNYFQHVLVHNDKTQITDQEIPINVELSPRKPQRYHLGFGYGTDTGPRASLNWDWRWTNENGHYMTGFASASPILDRLITRYVIPGNNPSSDQYNVAFNLQKLALEQGKSLTYQLGLNYLTQATWKQTLSLNYRGENSQFTGKEKIETYYLLPSVSWQLRKTNNPFFTTKGYHINVSLRGSLQIFSKYSFLQTELETAYIHPITAYNQWIARFHGGYTLGEEQFEKLPLSLHFFTGGAHTLRGYRYQSLGPGRYLLTGTAEIQQYLSNHWYTSIFYDAGNAFNFFPMSAEQSAGLGLIWVSPIGAIALTLSKSLSRNHTKPRIQLSMGPNL